MKKKIAFVIESLHLGGAEKSLVTLLQNLDFEKYEIDLITFHSGGFFADILPKEVNPIILDFPRINFLDRLKFKVSKLKNPTIHHAQLFWPLVSKYLKEYSKNYDIAIAYNQGFATYFVAEFIQAKKKYAWINTDYQKASYSLKKDINYYNKFSVIITVSQEAHDGFLRECEKEKLSYKTRIIKDISDKDDILKKSNEKSLYELKGKIKILTVGRLAKPKGLELAIASCKILRDKNHDIYWYVLGEGSERRFLESKIKEVGLENNFFLLGADTNPYPYMKACNIYVQTSLFEGLGLTVIEASYLNKPIVSTNFPTVYGILEDEETALIAEMNPESIANQIERLLTDETLKNKLITNLSQRTNTDKQKTLEQVEEMLGRD